MKERVDFLVLGAGVSGLSFVNFLDNKDYLILEKENEVGGYCKTQYVDEYTWDYSGHFFHFKNSELKNFFLDNMKGNEILEKVKNTKIYYKKLYIDYPFQKNIHQLNKEEFMECLYDLYFKKEMEKSSNFEEMLFSKFGKGITQKFLKPYNEKLYACNLNKLDTNAMGRFFPYANIEEIIKNFVKKDNSSYNDKFIYPKKGAISYINVLYNKVEKNKIRFNSEVKLINTEEKFIICSSGEKIFYKYLINTIPLNKFLEKIKNNPFINEMNKFTSNKVLVFNLGFDKSSIDKDIHWIYFPEKEYNFYRVGFYNNILNEEKLSLYVEIGFKTEEKISIEFELDKTLKNLREVGIIKEHILKKYSSIIMEPAYVHITKESESLKNKVKEYLAINNIYTIGRYGNWEYSSIEDGVIMSKNLAEIFNLKGKNNNENINCNSSL